MDKAMTMLYQFEDLAVVTLTLLFSFFVDFCTILNPFSCFRLPKIMEAGPSHHRLYFCNLRVDLNYYLHLFIIGKIDYG